MYLIGDIVCIDFVSFTNSVNGIIILILYDLYAHVLYITFVRMCNAIVMLPFKHGTHFLYYSVVDDLPPLDCEVVITNYQVSVRCTCRQLQIIKLQ